MFFFTRSLSFTRRHARKHLEIKITVPEYCCVIHIKVIYSKEQRDENERKFLYRIMRLRKRKLLLKPAIVVVEPMAMEEENRH